MLEMGLPELRQARIRRTVNCLDKLAYTSERSGLTFRPLSPRRQYRFRFVWKKYQMLSPASELFLRAMKAAFAE